MTTIKRGCDVVDAVGFTGRVTDVYVDRGVKMVDVLWGHGRATSQSVRTLRVVTNNRA